MGTRPALIVSNDRANAGHTVVIVAPITNTVPTSRYPSCLRFADLTSPGTITGCARFDGLQAVRRNEVDDSPVHVLTGADLEAVNEALRDAVGL